MKRSTLLIALAAPLMLGASLPAERPALPHRSAEIVEVNVIDRFLKDTGIRKQSSTREKARTRSRNTSRNAIPKPPPLASVPLPIPKPTETAQKATPEPPLPAEKPGETENRKPEDQAAPPEANSAENKPAQSEVARPDEKAASSPAKPETEDQARPPVVEQPSTATEPAREAEVPTPLPKPETDTAATKPDGAAPASPEKPAENQPAQAETKPDGTKPDEGEQEKAETPPPPPLVKEDPQELQACLTDLKAIGAKFAANDPIDDGNGCGIEHPVDVAEVLPGVELGGATMRCKTALTMAHWLKDTVQPAMNIAMPGRKIVGLVPGSTYQCRLRNSASTGKISEHARGNAYDVAAFKLDNGEKIVMKPRTEDSTLEGAFQRTATAGACLHFTTVLSPGSDEAHEDHLHLDILERNGGYRYCR
jgi:hypothetical protein